ncbi:hypothetical protein PQG67_09775 [Corynebacterium pseudodiphtheriticum]|uniref:hypothetical protein n=1 Tax=Corynebacterium pseudodiphtheriticum TaxID=37637 RepID=UPI00234E1187|nr:hypothetical protein [Corynebacterium pseudodiphtheriticum]MDC7069127.1 hypothetical protein [Corynebacterium pseudodiphtheriticum]MDC7087227.1 hypothetical protein [Corynebacterium pseudodiphtheriticum]
MQTVFSWLTSQSGVSLLVALIALGGLLINNRAAEKRRRADQKAADQRRKDDQAAEDARRKADDDRRERERLEDRQAEDKRRQAEQDAADQRRKDDQAAEDARRKADDDRRERERREQLQREDWERQRRAVADCTGAIFTAAQGVHDAIIQVQRDKPMTPLDAMLVEKATALGRFYREAAAYLNQCDLEVTQPHVSEQIAKVWACIEHDQKKLEGNGDVHPDDIWLAAAKELQPLSTQTLKELRYLTIVARLSLLECPKHMANQPVIPLDGDKDNGK